MKPRYGAWLAALCGPALFACNALLGLGDPSIESGAVPDGSFVEASDEATTDAAAISDGGGHCTPVRGPCDLVLQDCLPAGNGHPRECAVSGSGPSTTTECLATTDSQKLARGSACCIDQLGDNPCQLGLTCVGPTCAESRGLAAGRCAPFCCPGDNGACGTSIPEGIKGACDLSLVAGDLTLGQVCSYRTRCQFFGLERCAPTETCLLEAPDGSAHCLTSLGKKLRDPCSFANECADGLVCLGGSVPSCRTLCLAPDTVTPFDASVLDGGPGAGGCAEGEVCSVAIASFPDWLRACAYADGG